MQHLKSLDGLRGVAVLLVIFFHMSVPGFSLGWAGVPIFFCLSGFLITNILLKQKEKPFKEFITTFLINRSLRIFPLFYLYLTINYALLILMGKDTGGYIWFVTYLQNYYIGVNHSTPGILGHTWSLAVEEQFYWFWPLVIYFVSRKHLTATCVFLISLSLISRYFIFKYTQDPYMINVTLISCVDMLVLGALFAVFKDKKGTSGFSAVVFCIGMIGIIYAIVTNPISAFWEAEGWAGKYWYLFTALGMVFSPVIFYLYKKETTERSGILVSILTGRFITFTGKISYGLYMWHTLCLVVIEKAFPLVVDSSSILFYTSTLISTYAVSTVSYYLFESYFLRLKKHEIQPKADRLPSSM